MKQLKVLFSSILIIMLLTSCEDNQSIEEQGKQYIDLENQIVSYQSKISELENELKNLNDKQLSSIVELQERLQNTENNLARLTMKLDDQNNNFENFASTRCNDSIVNESISLPHVFDPKEVKVGDVIAGFMITSSDLMYEPNGDLMAVVMNFCDKEVTVSGSYEILEDDTDFFNGINFYLNEKSSDKIPLMNKYDGKPHSLQFRSDEAKEALLPHGKKGEATIKISGYSIHWWPKDDIRDNTTFLKVISVNQ